MLERHYSDMKTLMTNYRKLILENRVVLEKLEMEYQEKGNEDTAYEPEWAVECKEEEE